jgi:hypothetical protein
MPPAANSRSRSRSRIGRCTTGRVPFMEGPTTAARRRSLLASPASGRPGGGCRDRQREPTHPEGYPICCIGKLSTRFPWRQGCTLSVRIAAKTPGIRPKTWKVAPRGRAASRFAATCCGVAENAPRDVQARQAELRRRRGGPQEISVVANPCLRCGLCRFSVVSPSARETPSCRGETPTRLPATPSTFSPV